MANRFWVGGSGAWDTTSTTNWAATTGGAPGASAPTSVDSAVFDANSGSNYTVTLGEPVSVSVVTANAAVGLTLNFQTHKITVNANAAIVYRANGIVEYLGTPVIDLAYSGATSTRTVVPGGSSVTNPLSVNVVSGSDIVALSAGTAGLYGSLNFTGFSGTLATQTASTSIFGNLTFSSGMTISPATGTYTFAGTSGPQQITTAGKTVDMPINFNGIGGTFEFQDALTQGSTRVFTLTNGMVKLKDGATSIVGLFATSGANRKYLQSTAAGVRATLSQASGTVNANNLTIQSINATGGATWDALTANGNVDAGNNLGWNFGAVVDRMIFKQVFRPIFSEIFRPIF